jgi:hypothetical protein
MEAAKSKGKHAGVYAPDASNGADTLSYLEKTLKVVRRISGNDTGSLGLHPAVYFYSPSGNFQSSAFLGVVMLIQGLEAGRKFLNFTDVRGDLETILLENKHFIGDTTHKLGSGHRSSPWVRDLLEKLLSELWTGSSVEQVVKAILVDEKFSYLAQKKQS